MNFIKKLFNFGITKTSIEDIPIQYNENDLSIALENVKYEYYKLNEEHQKQ